MQGMAVIPVGPGLPKLETVQVRLARIDTIKAHARYAVHVRRQQNPVPMDRRLGAARKMVRDAQVDSLSLAPAQEGCWKAVVDRDRRACAPRKVDGGRTNVEIEVRVSQRRSRACVKRIPGVGGDAQQAGACRHSAQGKPLDEPASSEKGGRMRPSRYFAGHLILRVDRWWRS